MMHTDERRKLCSLLAAVVLLAVLQLPVAARSEDGQALLRELEERVELMRVQGEYEEALVVAEEFLKVAEESPDALPFDAGDGEWLVQAMRTASNLPPAERRELTVVDSLGPYLFACWREGRVREAIPIAERVVEAYRRTFGGQHPEVARALNNLAGMLWAMGEYADAEVRAREGLGIYRATLGYEHPDVAFNLDYLAALRSAQGDYAEAVLFERQSVALQRKLLGDEHQLVAAGFSNLGILLEAQGDYAGAEPLLRRALAMYRSLLGPEDRRVALGLSNLAGLVLAQGDDIGAATLYNEALKIWQ
ncbi:MAG: tetratricopeptide repeat protein, partial [Candidatus Eisenbacteria sp.]|nr:tetratricopeptide repeat protein [Candidatus Eisenbacteria bacterium]